MYKKIIVPLDGSKLAEQVLPHLNQIAKGCGVTEIVLITITEKIKGFTRKAEHVEDYNMGGGTPTILFADRFSTGRTFSIDPSTSVPVSVGKMAKSGHEYLMKVAKQLDKEGLPASVVVLSGNVADEIANFAKQESADLVIMASKGRTSLRKWDVANAADQVFKKVENIPIMLVKPPYGFKETKPVRKGKAL